MMDEETRDRLKGIAACERFEKWLEEQDAAISCLTQKDPAAWTYDDAVMARAAILTQRLILRVERTRRLERLTR